MSPTAAHRIGPRRPNIPATRAADPRLGVVARLPPGPCAPDAPPRRRAARRARPVARRVRRAAAARRGPRPPAADERARGPRAAVAERHHPARRPTRRGRHGRALHLRHRRPRRRGGAHAGRPRSAARTPRPRTSTASGATSSMRSTADDQQAIERGLCQVIDGLDDAAAGDKQPRRRAPTPDGSTSTPVGRVLAGTSGFAYAAWAPLFYPAGSRSRDLLPHYASRLAACELNNTFYARPTVEKIDGWCAATPADFRFVVKAQRGASIRSLYADPATSVPWLTETLPAFGERLGAVLFRVPGEVKRQDERLAGLLGAWPATLPLVLEVAARVVARRRDVRRAARGRRRPVHDRPRRAGHAAGHPAHRPVPLPAAAPDGLRRRGARRVGATARPVPRRRARRVRPVPARRGRHERDPRRGVRRPRRARPIDGLTGG